MNTRNVIEFIEWLERNKDIYLVDITNDDSRFVTGYAHPSDWDELEKHIEEYKKEVYK